MADLEAHPAGELAPQGFSVYSHKRSHKDVAWTAAYALLNGICFFWAIAAFAKQWVCVHIKFITALVKD